jgi:hypothetical protein
LIRDRLGVPVDMVKGRHGQFDVEVNGQLVVSRKGGLLAMLMSKPWPDGEDLVGAVRDALDSAAS